MDFILLYLIAIHLMAALPSEFAWMLVLCSVPVAWAEFTQDDMISVTWEDMEE